MISGARTKAFPTCDLDSPLWDVAIGEAVDAAIRNVTVFGDTDLFPEPIESEWIRQAPAQAREAVLALHDRFAKHGLRRPETLRVLFPVGNNGYRLGTQIDPVWNLYLLSLVILAAPKIESARRPCSHEVVFSFRFSGPDERGRLFDPEYGWRTFNQRTLELAGCHAQVVVCDVSDFYHRIGPDFARAALQHSGVAPELAKLIARVLRALKAETLGLPIGGPASRIIAEAVFSEIDELLEQHGVVFCRFVDDIRIFTATRDTALNHLALLSRALLLRGLSLQKSKTRILPGRELAAELAIGQGLHLTPSKGGDASPGGLGAESADLKRLLLAPAQFDPYSGLRAQRDARLEMFAQHPDALLLLQREFSKSRVNPALARNMVSALAFMPCDEAEQALLFLLNVRRQPVVLPVVGKLLTVALEQAGRLGDPAQRRLRDALLAVLHRGGALLHLPSSQAQALRVLQTLPPEKGSDTRALWQRLFTQSTDTLVRRELLLLWGAWGDADALRTISRGPRLHSGWEQRALAWALTAAQLPPAELLLPNTGRRPPGPCDTPWAQWLAAWSANLAATRSHSNSEHICAV